jgi:DNA transformation protein
MGERGAKQTQTAKEFTAEMVEALTPVGDVKSRAMFGGFGIFESGTMFVLIDSEAQMFFRADSTTKSSYEELGSKRHTPMPYYEVPVAIADDYSVLIEWAKEAAAVAHAAKKKSK